MLARHMTDQPRDPATEVHRVADPSSTRVASYLAQSRRGRARPAALLGRSRHERDAQVDPGRVRGGGGRADRQPRPARRGLRGRQGQGAAAGRARLPRRRRARGVRRGVRAPGDQGQRRLRRRLPALHRARAPADRQARGRVRAPTGCDTIAHGCTGKGNDQVRIEGTVATLAPELKVIAPVRSWAMGRDEEIAYARKHGIPVKGGTEAAPYSIDDNLWGRSSEGKWIEDLSHAPDDDVFQLVTRPELAPDEAQVVDVTFEAGVPVALNGERLGLVELIERAAEIGMRHGVGIVDHIEDRIVGLKVRDIYEVPAAAILLKAHKELERLTGTIHQNQFKPRARPQVGVPRLRRPVVGAAARGHRGLHRPRQHARDRHDRAQALQGQRARRHARERRTRSTTPSSRRSPSPAGCSPSRPRRASSSCGRCSRAWPGACARATRGRLGAWLTRSSA